MKKDSQRINKKVSIVSKKSSLQTVLLQRSSTALRTNHPPTNFPRVKPTWGHQPADHRPLRKYCTLFRAPYATINRSMIVFNMQVVMSCLIMAQLNNSAVGWVSFKGGGAFLYSPPGAHCSAPSFDPCSIEFLAPSRPSLQLSIHIHSPPESPFSHSLLALLSSPLLRP